MADNSNTGMPEDERKTSDLLALLYPEEGSELENSEFVSSDELGDMQSLRSLFRDLPEEEPSDAVTNKLMAMAAQHAPKAHTESKGIFAWFSDLLMPLVVHPGLAAAATLVLVVGVAGTLYVKGGAQMAEPEVSSLAKRPDMAPASEPSVSPTGSTATADTSAVAADEGEAPSEDPAAVSEIATGAFEGGDSDSPGDSLTDKRERLSDVLESKPDLDKKDSKRGAKRKKSSGPGALGGLSLDGNELDGFGKGGGGSAGGRASGKETTRRSSAKNQPEPSNTASTRQQPLAPSKAPAPKPSPEPKQKPQSKVVSDSPPPPPQARDLADSEDDSGGGVEEKVQEQEQSAPRASDLHAQAVRAAKNGNCKRALDLGNQIRKIDSAYYDRTFLSDARLKACRNASK